MTWKEKIMDYVSKFPGATDSDIENYYRSKYPKVRHQTINSECRYLESLGLLERKSNPDKDGLIGNYPTGKVLEVSVEANVVNQVSDGEPLQEEDNDRPFAR